jgi:hypothetical protein
MTNVVLFNQRDLIFYPWVCLFLGGLNLVQQFSVSFSCSSDIFPLHHEDDVHFIEAMNMIWEVLYQWYGLDITL